MGTNLGAGTIFLVDDNDLLRETLEDVMAAAHLPIESFASAEAYLEVYDPTRPGCLILDLTLPGMSGMELFQRLQELGNPLPVIVLSGCDNMAVAVDAMNMGAFHYFIKPLSIAPLVDKVKQGMELDVQTHHQHRKAASAVEQFNALSQRERQVFASLAQGQRNKQVGEALGISVRTVEVYRKQIYQKLGVDSVVGLVEISRQLGDIPGHTLSDQNE